LRPHQPFLSLLATTPFSFLLSTPSLPFESCFSSSLSLFLTDAKPASLALIDSAINHERKGGDGAVRNADQNEGEQKYCAFRVLSREAKMSKIESNAVQSETIAERDLLCLRNRCKTALW